MFRTITISTDVFAAIWAKRKNGEDSEDAILQRLLGCKLSSVPAHAPSSSPAPIVSGGVLDARNGVRFPEGFEIFRTYRHQEYKARAKSGVWFREDNGQSYSTLNQLNQSIAAGTENVWNGNWKYRDDQGKICSIDKLRR